MRGKIGTTHSLFYGTKVKLLNAHRLTFCLHKYKVGSKPKLGSARLGFGSSFLKKKLGSARHTFQKARLGSARHILQKKLCSAWLTQSVEKPSYIEKEKMSWFPTFLPIWYNPEDINKSVFFLLKIFILLKNSTENSQK